MTDQPKADERGRSLPPVSPAEEHRAATTRTVRVSDIFAQLAQMQGEGATTYAQVEDQRMTRAQFLRALLFPSEGDEDEEAQPRTAHEEMDELQQAYLRLAEARRDVMRLEKAAAEQDLRERSIGNNG